MAAAIRTGGVSPDIAGALVNAGSNVGIAAGAALGAQVFGTAGLGLGALPFVAAVVDLDGTSVSGNIVNTEPDPEHVTLGMKVRLTTFPIGTDDEGTEAIGFGFEPLEVG